MSKHRNLAFYSVIPGKNSGKGKEKQKKLCHPNLIGLNLATPVKTDWLCHWEKELVSLYFYTIF